MTSTTIFNAVACGTGANQGNLFNPVKTTLQAGTTTVKIAVKMVFGAGTPLLPTSVIRVRHAVSPTSYTDATVGALALRGGAEGVDIPMNPQQSLTLEVSSEVLVTAAGYHYCWAEMPGTTVAAALTVILQELP